MVICGDQPYFDSYIWWSTHFWGYMWELAAFGGFYTWWADTFCGLYVWPATFVSFMLWSATFWGLCMVIIFDDQYILMVLYSDNYVLLWYVVVSEDQPHLGEICGNQIIFRELYVVISHAWSIHVCLRMCAIFTNYNFSLVLPNTGFFTQIHKVISRFFHLFSICDTYGWALISTYKYSIIRNIWKYPIIAHLCESILPPSLILML